MARSVCYYTGEGITLADSLRRSEGRFEGVGGEFNCRARWIAYIILLLAIIVHSRTLDSNFMIMKYGSHVLLAVSKGDSLYNASVYAKRFIEEVIYLIEDGSIKNSYKTTYGEFCDLELSEIHYI